MYQLPDERFVIPVFLSTRMEKEKNRCIICFLLFGYMSSEATIEQV
jgi:hypothetical protein